MSEAQDAFDKRYFMAVKLSCSSSSSVLPVIKCD